MKLKLFKKNENHAEIIKGFTALKRLLTNLTKSVKSNNQLSQVLNELSKIKDKQTKMQDILENNEHTLNDIIVKLSVANNSKKWQINPATFISLSDAVADNIANNKFNELYLSRIKWLEDVILIALKEVYPEQLEDFHPHFKYEK